MTSSFRAPAAVAAPVRRLTAAARRQPRWFAAACSLCLFYLLFLGGMKAISTNAVDLFFEHLPARAAASPVQGALPYCLDFDHPTEVRATQGEFALSGFENWEAPGRWTEGPSAGIAVALPDQDLTG